MPISLVAAGPDDTPVPESPSDPPKTEQAPAEKGDAEKTPAEKVSDDELSRSLDAETGEFLEQALDHLQQAFDGMQAARKRIADEDTGAETQKTQERVVQELEDLLALVKKQQSRMQQRSRQNQNQNENQEQQQPDRQKLPPGQNDPQNSGRGKTPGKKPDDPGERRGDKSTDSQERTDAARRPADEQARRRQVIKDVWGHLPPHIREAMLNSVSEKYLPKYEDLVKKYYEDLAEKNRKPNAK